MVEQATIDGNKMGFNRPLSPAEERFARMKSVQLFGEAFPRWGLQFMHWAGEMMGYNPQLWKKVLKNQAQPEEMGRYLGRMATGIGGLYMIDKLLYSPPAGEGYIDTKSMEWVNKDGDRVRLGSIEPLSTPITMLAGMHYGWALATGDTEAAKKHMAMLTGAARFSSIPGMRALYGEGGLLGSMIKPLADGMEKGKIDFKNLRKEAENNLNKMLPGQAILGALKTVFDPEVREGVGANVPGISLLKEPVINLATGEPYKAKQRVAGIEFPAITGTPVPMATRILEPTAKILSRYGMLTYRGPRAPIAGYPAAEAPEDVTREWSIEFGKQRDRIFRQVIPYVEAQENRLPPGALREGNPFYEQTRKLLMQYDAIAAKQARDIVTRRHGAVSKLPRQATIREERLGR